MEADPRVRRLPFKRIAVTAPPPGWFHGVTRALFDLYRQALVDLGLDVFDVPVDAFLPPDPARIAGLVADLRAFQPEFALGLSHGSHALVCRLAARRDGWRPCLFTEVLDLPTICLWDHAPLEFADQLLSHPLAPDSSTAGAMEALRRVLTHPRLIHWSRDSGQTRIMKNLGLLLPGRLVQELAPALPGFCPRETPAEDGVGFVGHFYQEPAGYPHPALAGLAAEAVEMWMNAGEPALWDVLERQIGRLPAGLLQPLALDRDQAYFWHFAHRLIVHQAQTASRLKVLGSAHVPVACYGNLRTDVPGVPGNLVPAPGHTLFGPPLSALLARHAITVDVLNPGFIHGYSHKPILGFASGGFMLIDRKQDFAEAFGEAGEAVSCRAGEIAAKVDRFLGNPKYRREVGDEIRQQITARFQLCDVLARVLHAAFELAENHRSPSGLIPPLPGQNTEVIVNLLPEMRCEPHWSGASVEHRESGVFVSTAPQPWSYAAGIGIPLVVSELNEPHLRVRLMVEAGRIGLAALRNETGTFLNEQVISPSADPVTVTVELPREGAITVILQNTAETASRALVLEAVLCDRSG